MKFHYEDVPMMYRAQVDGRCSIQYAQAKEDLQNWTEEWVFPDENNENQPSYQHQEPEKLNLDGSVYRIKVEFPCRVFTNCGQDSILRPTIGKNGIPFIPGSSIKGLFRRLQNHPAVNKTTIDRYCGTEEEPGILRFHGAYPIGDWAGTRNVEFKNGYEKTRYGIVDLVHPQQTRQIQHKGGPQANPLISFYRPTLIFELSSIKPLSEKKWEEIGGWLIQALRSGLGGKTSTGYGLGLIVKRNSHKKTLMPKDKYPLSVELRGRGVSSLLLTDEPEFRPNLFKATLRGHVTRLLAGVSQDEEAIKNKVDKLFGCTEESGNVELYWQSKSDPEYDTLGKEQTLFYKTVGELFLDAPQKDQAFLQKVLEFTFVMAGLGKSWRRVWHDKFYSQYKTRAIGCHWEWLDSEIKRTKIQSSQGLNDFLTKLHEQTKQYMGVSLNSELFMPWCEAWSPKRLSVFSQEVSQSKAIKLFHREEFKNTLAIGGRKPGGNRPTCCSLVWHRMLPIEDDKYLEIVTLFHGNESSPSDWKGKNKRGKWENMLPPFVNQLEKICGFQQTWGNISLPIE
ncbi:MAG: hypothetical protein F6K48_08350 [Okeania sp. SIO3H1]|nr:hypothetical protein [Okeania sp. SIO3H1]